MLLLGDPGIDLWITFILFGVSSIIALIFFALAKRKILAVIVFSILANISVWLNIGSQMFVSYNIEWLKPFSVFIWPVLNIILIIYYAKTKPKK